MAGGNAAGLNNDEPQRLEKGVNDLGKCSLLTAVGRILIRV